MNYFYADPNNQPIGPCTAEQIQQFYLQGTLHKDSWVIVEGTTEWKPYSAVLGTPKRNVAMKFLHFLLSLFSIKGRCSRAEYGWKVVVAFIISLVPGSVLLMVYEVTGAWDIITHELPFVLSALMVLVLFALPLALTVRRLHDFGWSGFSLCSFALFVGIYLKFPENIAAKLAGWPFIHFLYVFGCAVFKQGTVGSNEYGDDPLDKSRVLKTPPPGVPNSGFTPVLPAINNNGKAVRFSCPHCNQHIEAPREILGTAIDCPSCGKRFQLSEENFSTPSLDFTAAYTGPTNRADMEDRPNFNAPPVPEASKVSALGKEAAKKMQVLCVKLGEYILPKLIFVAKKAIRVVNTLLRRFTNRFSKIASDIINVKCPACNAQNEYDAMFCNSCGAKLEKPPVAPPNPICICPQCSTENDASSKYCSKCGAKVLQTVVAPAARSMSPSSLPCTPVSSVAPPTKLQWYEQLWVALPIALIAVGGAIGGACGGMAWAINKTVFKKTESPVHRYVFTGLISASAVIVWFVVAMLFFSLFK